MQRISTPSEAEFVLRFTAYGTPQTQGSLSRSWSWAQKRVITRDKPALYAWRDEVALAARRRLPRGFKPFDGPVTLGVLFVLVRTPTDTRLKRQFPETHLDLDKALRAICDALTGVVLTNDARVVGFDPAPWKVFGAENRVDVIVRQASANAAPEESNRDPSHG